ncbi:MAG: ATP-binding cassette, subfamily bacterial, partial [Thermomicrobiales bacterium]|nr:ATP-binding cassette, subfamily bacterial [Thermomicrobiales bacterium]
VPRWFGSSAAAASLVVDGIAGVVAARIGTRPSLDELDAAVRGELAAGRVITLFDAVATPLPGGSTTGTMVDVEAASFVGYLVRTFGEQALRQFLAAYDPARRDHAAIAAYHQPLAALEEAWIGNLRQQRGNRAAFRLLFRQLAPLLRPYRKREVEVFAYMLFELVYGVVLALASKYLIDTVIPEGSTSKLAGFVALLLILFVLDGAVGLRRAYVSNWINTRVILELRVRIFAHLQRLPHGFYARARIGDLMARLSGDLALIDQALSQVAGVGVFMALRAIVAAVTLVVLSPILGGLVLVVVPVFAVVYLSLRSRLQKASYDLQKLEGEVAGAAHENLSAHAVIKAFGLERSTVSSYRGRMDRIFTVTMRLVFVGGLFETSIGLATTLGQLVVLGVGGYLVIDGGLSVGTLVAFIGLLPSLFSPIASLSNVGQTVEQASGALERVREVLDEPVTIADQAGAAELPPLSREIRLEQVTFGYEPNRPILRNLTMSIPAGAHVAIVGPSGCGKSSVINLLLRFFDPQEGRVLFDGQDVREVTLASLRGQAGIVFQDTFVFDTTVRENIAIGRDGARDEEVIAAAQAAELDEYIAALPAGYDTVLGERGVRMSGGQRQRLAIARALVRNPRILILDEATSALDAQTEAEVLATIERLARDRTTISITHRLSVAAAADHVLVMDRGRLVEEGTHHELLARGGLYRRLYDEQVGAGSSIENTVASS